VTYTKVPQRVVVNDDALIATMFALGLEDRIVGIAGVDQVQVLQQKYPEATRKARVLSKDYITKEALLGANPDFVFAGYGYGFSQEKGVTPESLKALGVTTYLLTEACLQEGQGGARGAADPLSSLYLDMTNLGKIFGIEARAEQLVASYKARVQAAQRSLPPGKPPVSVFLYDSGTDAPLTSGAYAVPNDLIKLAGGRNVFDDVKDSWTTVTWEEVVKRDPAFILIADYVPTHDVDHYIVPKDTAASRR
jgi:iron complex transport system substrate-binding protein